MCIVESLPSVCRAPPFVEFPTSKSFSYRTAKITLENTNLAEPFTNNDACSALRGIAEYLSSKQLWFEWSFQIYVAGTVVGDGQLVNMQIATALASGEETGVATLLVASVPAVSASVAVKAVTSASGASRPAASEADPALSSAAALVAAVDQVSTLVTAQ